MIKIIKDFFNKRSKLIGKRIKIVQGDSYLNHKGTIEYCSRCCHTFRIQFDNIGNNERYDYYKEKLIFINLTEEE